MDAGQPDGEALAAISNGLAQLHLRLYGRGPAKVKTHAIEDLVVCLLWDGFTTVERTLLSHGERDAVEAFRRTSQHTLGDQFVDVVEEATGRNVRIYMSQVHVRPDVAIEMFMLEPEI